MSNGSHYAIGEHLTGDREIILTIRPIGLTLEQFRADLPRIISRLESDIQRVHGETATAGGER